MSKTKSELEFEDELIQALSTGTVSSLDLILDGERFDSGLKSKLWEYREDIHTEDDLWQNFKEILEQHNQQTLDHPLSRTEFDQVKKEIRSWDTPFKAGRMLYGINGKCQIEVDMDDGRHVFLNVFDQSEVGAGGTIYQVVHQIVRPAVISGKKDRRFDVTLLINGLPIIQIELKKATGSANEALNQMHQYIQEAQYTGIFSTVQILVGMTPHEIRYMANTTADTFNKDFAFEWQNSETNKPVYNWKEFTDRVLSIPAAHKLATNYMVLDASPHRESIKVMRSYQVAATEKALQAIRHRDPDMDINRLGFIWHTTGSGKTITSFKTAWLASKIPTVDKVVFVVDRLDLIDQTLTNYRAYNPEAIRDEKASSIKDTRNTWELSQSLKAKNMDIVVTSFQKLSRLVSGKNFKAPDRRFLFIVDEAHRSTKGESFAEIQKAFKHASWIGYSGTPLFESKGKEPTTVDIFGKCLHAYTIREAIADRNVLGFKVDFKTTLPKEAVLEKYLPEFYHQQHPEWSEQEIDYKIQNMSDDDFDDQVTKSFYDNNPKHVEAVVADIFENWNNRSVNGKYNAMLTTHVQGGSSTPMAMMYFDEFQRVNAIREKEGKPTLKVAVTFSEDTSNKNGMVETNLGLERAIDAYDDMFGTEFDLNTVKEYQIDLQTRLKQADPDGNNLDLVIVVDRLLTGFDAPKLNTLYVDRTLKGAGLIQAYSRTNRLANLQEKPFGHVVNYRWPEKNEKYMNEALAIYSNKKYAELSPAEQKDLNIDGGILAKDFKDALDDFVPVVQTLREMTDNFTEIPKSEAKREEMLKTLREYNAGMSRLKQYTVEDVESVITGMPGADIDEMILAGVGMTQEQAEVLEGPLTNRLRVQIGEDKKIPASQVDLQVVHFRDVKVNYDYLTELLEELLNTIHEKKAATNSNVMDKGTGKSEEDLDTDIETIREKIAKFANGLSNKSFAKDIAAAVEAIVEGEYPPAGSDLKYPYKLTNSEEVVKKAQMVTRKKMMEEFISKWGLQGIVEPVNFLNFIKHHVYGEKDLDESGSLTELIKKGQAQYREKASEEVLTESKTVIKYRNNLRKAIYELADNIVLE